MKKYEELTTLLIEEAEIVEADTETEPELRIDSKSLRTAATKLNLNKTNLTTKEKNAIADALTDVGELYRFAGTTAGYRTESTKEAREAQAFGERALKQAVSLGVKI